jgi:hypothetical protein
VIFRMKFVVVRMWNILGNLRNLRLRKRRLVRLGFDGLRRWWWALECKNYVYEKGFYLIDTLFYFSSPLRNQDEA